MKSSFLKSSALLFFAFSMCPHISWAQVHEEECVKPWVFFDLGNTIVDTKTNDYNPMFYMEDVSKKLNNHFIWKDGALYINAKAYVDKLNADKTTLGMLIDIPEEWGTTDPPNNPILDIPTAKIVRTLDFLAGKYLGDHASWRKDEGDVEFDSKPFGTFQGSGADLKFAGQLILPQKNSERKKVSGHSNSTILFERAVAMAAEKGCKAIYQGEDTDEMKLADDAGMVVFQVGVTSKKYFYIPPNKLSWYAENYKEGLWTGLGQADFE
jgi:hypothetical protein